MADKGEGTSVNRKEKKLLIEEDLGKDFLSSWKSLSVTEDEAMDFSFGTVSKGKKKAFDFDKLDMDFNLDGDFDKLSSFKVDMPDIDFSCPPKKTAKPKEGTEDDSSNGKRQRKQDDFSFNFDFNDVDFSCAAKIESKSVDKSRSFARELVIDEPVLPRNESTSDSHSSSEGFNVDDIKSGSKPVGDIRSQDKQVAQQEPAMLRNEKIAQSVVSMYYLFFSFSLSLFIYVYMDEKFNTNPKLLYLVLNSEDSHANDVQTRDEVVNNKVTLTNNSTDDERVSFKSNFHANDVHTKSESVGNTMSITIDSTEGEPISLRRENNVSNLNDIKYDSESTGNKLIVDASPKDQQVEKGSTGAQVTFYSTNFDKEVPESSDSEVGNKLVGDAIPQDQQAADREPFMPENERNTGVDFKKNAIQTGEKLAGSKSISREVTDQPDFQGSEKNFRNLTNVRKGIISDDAQNGKSIGGKSRPQDKETTTGSVVLRQKSSSFQLNPSGSTEAKTLPRYQASENLKFVGLSMESIRNTNNLSVEGAKTGKTMPELSSLKSLRSIGANKNYSRSTVTQKSSSFRNFEDNTRLTGNVTSNVAHSFGSNEKHKLVTSSLKRKSLEEPNAALVSLNPLKRLSESPKENRVFKESLDSLKPLKHFSESPKENRMFKESLDSLKPLKRLSEYPKENRMLKGSLDSLKPLKHLSESPKENRMLTGALDSLKPLRQLSESPKENKMLKESLNNTVKEQVSNDVSEEQNNTNNVLPDHPTPGLEVSEDVSMREVETLPVTEDDGNVEKAEVYTKQLEDLCCMLKKKHEEAKEILVRAVVNNNYLLMLNHPIHEEKIHMIQKFSPQLVLKEIPR